MKRIRLLRFAQLFLTAVVLGTGSLARTQSLAPEYFERQPMDRMAAWNYALVRTYERAPVSRLLTYVRENYGIQYTALARIVPQVEVDGRIYTAAEATDIRVEDFPGGVEARFRLGGVEVESRFTPLMVGTGESTRVGAAVYSIRTESDGAPDDRRIVLATVGFRGYEQSAVRVARPARQPDRQAG